MFLNLKRFIFVELDTIFNYYIEMGSTTFLVENVAKSINFAQKIQIDKLECVVGVHRRVLNGINLVAIVLKNVLSPVSSDAKITINLFSTDASFTKELTIRNGGKWIVVPRFIPWDEFVDPKNGYIQNGTAKFQVTTTPMAIAITTATSAATSSAMLTELRGDSSAVPTAIAPSIKAMLAEMQKKRAVVKLQRLSAAEIQKCCSGFPKKPNKNLNAISIKYQVSY